MNVADRFAVAGPMQALEHCQRTLHLRRLYWCSDENWRLICFGNLIRTLYC